MKNFQIYHFCPLGNHLECRCQWQESNGKRQWEQCWRAERRSWCLLVGVTMWTLERQPNAEPVGLYLGLVHTHLENYQFISGTFPQTWPEILVFQKGDLVANTCNSILWPVGPAKVDAERLQIVEVNTKKGFWIDTCTKIQLVCLSILHIGAIYNSL